MNNHDTNTNLIPWLYSVLVETGKVQSQKQQPYSYTKQNKKQTNKKAEGKKQELPELQVLDFHK